MDATDRVFPLLFDQNDFSQGLTNRDYIAIKAMAAFIMGNKGSVNTPDIAEAAYEMADAMIEQSNK